MSMGHFFQKVFSNPGAFAQDFDDSFLLLTSVPISSEIVAFYKLKTVDHFTHCKIFAPTFFELKSESLKTFHHCMRVERDDIIFLLESYFEAEPNKQSNVSPLSWKLQDRSFFDDDFSKIQTRIQQGLIDKAVVVTTEESSWIPSVDDRMYLLLNLLKTCPKNLYIYSHWNEASGVIGASPEFLFYRNGKTIQTMALAGTLAKRRLLAEADSVTENEDSLLSPKHFALEKIKFIENQKELLEHQFVIDDLTEKLEEFVPSAVTHGPKVVEFPHLFHLQTEIQAELPETPHSETFDYQLTSRLHPSSALGLRSKKVHWHWLKELHGHQKLGHFGAPIGIRVPNGYFCIVGIRNLEWDQHGSYLRAGSGIVAQSNPDSEWQELEAKRESVKSLLGISH